MSYYNSLLSSKTIIQRRFECPRYESIWVSSPHSPPIPLLNTEFGGNCTIRDFEVGRWRIVTGQSRDRNIAQFTPERGSFWEYETRFTTRLLRAVDLVFWLWSKGSIRFDFFLFFFFWKMNFSREEETCLIILEGGGIYFRVQFLFLYLWIYYIICCICFYALRWMQQYSVKEKFILINTGKEL